MLQLQMDSSLRQIRNSATKKQLSKIFERGGSMDSVGSFEQRDQIYGRR